MAQSVESGPTTVKTERLLLRRLQQSDAAQIYQIRALPEVMKWTPTLPNTDVAQAEAWVASCLERSNCYNFVIEELNAPVPRIVGVLGAIRTPELGYIFHSDIWGKGYASEALAAFMPLLWEHVDPATAPEGRRYDYAEAYVDVENFGSRRVLEKCGFALWEVRRQDFDSPTMGLRDTAIYRIARPGSEKTTLDANNI